MNSGSSPSAPGLYPGPRAEADKRVERPGHRGRVRSTDPGMSVTFHVSLSRPRGQLARLQVGWLICRRRLLGARRARDRGARLHTDVDAGRDMR